MEENKRKDKDVERNGSKLLFLALKGERDQKNPKKLSLLTGRKYLKYPLIIFQIGTKEKKEKQKVRSLQDL